MERTFSQDKPVAVQLNISEAGKYDDWRLRPVSVVLTATKRSAGHDSRKNKGVKQFLGLLFNSTLCFRRHPKLCCHIFAEWYGPGGIMLEFSKISDISKALCPKNMMSCDLRWDSDLYIMLEHIFSYNLVRFRYRLGTASGYVVFYGSTQGLIGAGQIN